MSFYAGTKDRMSKAGPHQCSPLLEVGDLDCNGTNDLRLSSSCLSGAPRAVYWDEKTRAWSSAEPQPAAKP